ncbi:MAG: ATP/GTP-binding protein [Thaumarchaeota archaeon]|nr:ATP/GTP-binding protein [Nitrososphaerota archaeon]
MRTLKIVVTGAFNAGKTTLIKTLCGRILKTDMKLSINAVKQTTTVALDFGILRLEDKVIRLFGTPGQRRFHFMWSVLGSGMNGYILMVDTQDEESMIDAAYIYKFFRENFPETPHVISANKADCEKGLSEEAIREALNVPREVPVHPTIALRKDSALELVKLLVDLIERGSGV